MHKVWLRFTLLPPRMQDQYLKCRFWQENVKIATLGPPPVVYLSVTLRIFSSFKVGESQTGGTSWRDLFVNLELLFCDLWQHFSSGKKNKSYTCVWREVNFQTSESDKSFKFFRSGGGWVEPEQVDTGYGAMSSGEFSFIKLKLYFQSRSPHITLLDQSIKNINDKKK